MPFFILGCAALIVAAILLKVFYFIRNVNEARRTGLPYTFSLIHELETWAYITNSLIRWACTDYLLQERGWPKWARFMVKDWMYEDKGRAHQEFGETFLVVSPGGLVCYTANADVAMEICTRRKDFIKPREKMKMIEPFGPNVVSSEGDLWRYYIRITAQPFDDSVNRLVWKETVRQCNFLSQSWSDKGTGSLRNEVYLVGVNVMSMCGFGRQQDWTDDPKAIPRGHELSIVQSIFGVVMYLPHHLLIPKWLLKRSPWKAAHQSYKEFEMYMREFISGEKQKLENDNDYQSKMDGNLLTALLATNANVAKQAEKAGHAGTALSDDEVLGNLFMFFMAGYDTTANSIIFSCVTLALYPHLQEDLIQEIDRVFQEAKDEGRDELTYAEDFPKFRTVLAFLYEVIRVFPVVLPIGRVTVGPQHLTVPSTNGKGSLSTESKSHPLPNDCGTIVNIPGVHYNTTYWPEPERVVPQRWLTPNPNTYDPSSPPPRETIDNAQKDFKIPSHSRGTFLTFSEGMRACLGRKFAQSEYVAFFSHLLREYRISFKDTSPAHRDYVEKVMRNRSAGSPVTLTPAMDVGLKLEKRTDVGADFSA